MITQQLITEPTPYPITGSYSLRTWAMKGIPSDVAELMLGDDDQFEEQLPVRLLGRSTWIEISDPDLTKKLKDEITADEETLLKRRIEVFKDRYNKEQVRKNIFDRYADYTFRQLSALLSTVDFLNCDVEITSTEAIKFTFKLPGDRVLMISKSYQLIEGGHDAVVVFSMFHNRELLVSDAAEITELPKGISKYLAL